MREIAFGLQSVPHGFGRWEKIPIPLLPKVTPFERSVPKDAIDPTPVGLLHHKRIIERSEAANVQRGKFSWNPDISSKSGHKACAVRSPPPNAAAWCLSCEDVRLSIAIKIAKEHIAPRYRRTPLRPKLGILGIVWRRRSDPPFPAL